MHEYDLIADWYAAGRTGGMGVPEVTALAETLPAGASVLDVGCGTGLPLTRVLLDHGLDVAGIDSSARLLAYFHRNFPGVPTINAAIQSYDLGGRSFDAAIAWGVIFHLRHDEQAQAIASIARALRPDGTFLFTSGDEDGSVGGEMNGVPFRYYSFSVAGYRDLLRTHGLTLLDTHKDGGGNIYYLARKAARSASARAGDQAIRSPS